MASRRMPPSQFPTTVFFFNDTATTEIYTLSLHDALPISAWPGSGRNEPARGRPTRPRRPRAGTGPGASRSEEHTSELQSQSNLVCRLLLEKKNDDESDYTANSSATITADINANSQPVLSS